MSLVSKGNDWRAWFTVAINKFYIYIHLYIETERESLIHNIYKIANRTVNFRYNDGITMASIIIVSTL